MPSARKRKPSPGLDEVEQEPAKRRFVETDEEDKQAAQQLQSETLDAAEAAEEKEADTTPQPAEQPDDALAASSPEPSTTSRLARFKALQARNAESRKANLKETQNEAKRLAQDPHLLSSLQRKRDIAAHKLLKADTAAEGEDFERKRAWDWTIEESEAWDRRMEKKERHREDNGFADYRQQARKDYKRSMRQMQKATEDVKGEYERQKSEAVEKAIQRGGLEVVETEDGELVAVDRDGSFYSTADSAGGFEHRPSKEGLDRLVGEIKKAEESRLKKRRARGGDDGGDVTYINHKNKQFNDKLSRFYNKYTSDIRENLERGSAL